MFNRTKDYCTLWLDSLFGASWAMSCYQHDQDIENPKMPYMQANWWLMLGVWASSFSPNCDKAWKRSTIRAVSVIMLLATSTIGWPWRWYWLFKKLVI